jgi:exodeoxyribonuclease VII large subunit
MRVQGAGAADDIVAALEDLNDHPLLELLIVGRGGGSLEDLWPFNEERVARALAASRLPVISAVGHEIDLTIADLVADCRAPTPTGAAEMAMPRATDLAARIERCAVSLGETLRRHCGREQRRLQSLTRRVRDPRLRIVDLRDRTTGLVARMARAMRHRLDARRADVEMGTQRLELQHPAARLASVTRAVADCRHRLELAARHRLRASRERVARAAGSLHDLSPLAVLQRGYSLTRRWPGGSIVRDAGSLAPGEEIEITFAAGRTRARVARRRRRAP